MTSRPARGTPPNAADVPIHPREGRASAHHPPLTPRLPQIRPWPALLLFFASHLARRRRCRASSSRDGRPNDARPPCARLPLRIQRARRSSRGLAVNL